MRIEPGMYAVLAGAHLDVCHLVEHEGDAVRVNDRFQITDPIFANRLWLETGLRELVNGNSDAEDEDGAMSPEERRWLW